MFYDLECPKCDTVSEHMMEMSETEKWVKCPECGGEICRRFHRLYDVPQIQGDTVSGGCSYSYYDETLGQIKNKQHRKDLMKQKGLTEYNPDPTMKKHRDEARKIREHSRPSDPDAVAAIKKEYKTADSTRRDRLIKKSLDSSFKKLNV